jgi:hypothetical protein
MKNVTVKKINLPVVKKEEKSDATPNSPISTPDSGEGKGGAYDGKYQEEDTKGSPGSGIPPASVPDGEPLTKKDKKGEEKLEKDSGYDKPYSPTGEDEMEYTCAKCGYKHMKKSEEEEEEDETIPPKKMKTPEVDKDVEEEEEEDTENGPMKEETKFDAKKYAMSGKRVFGSTNEFQSAWKDGFKIPEMQTNPFSTMKH